MRIVEILSIALVAAGIAMHFTAAFGIGDHQTANSMISAGIGLIGGYAYGRWAAKIEKEELFQNFIRRVMETAAKVAEKKPEKKPRRKRSKAKKKAK